MRYTDTFLPTLYELLGVLKERKTHRHCTEAVDRVVPGFTGFGFFDVETSEFFLVELSQAYSEVQDKETHHWPSVGVTHSDLRRFLKTQQGRAQLFNCPKDA